MSAHTPGPWRTAPPGVKGCVPSADVIGGGRLICEVAEMDDARLIAAAPHMLSALRDAFDALSSEGSTVQHRREIATYIADAIAMATHREQHRLSNALSTDPAK